MSLPTGAGGNGRNCSTVTSNDLLNMLKRGMLLHDNMHVAPSKEPVTSVPDVNDDRGMLGLLNVIKATSTAANLAAVGVDLEGLDLALEGTEPVTRDWDSYLPINTTPSSSSTPHQHCYSLTPQIAANPAVKIGSFSDETLFYIFYAFPKDQLQELAARELTVSRGWRFHKKLQLWCCNNGEDADELWPASKQFTIVFDVASWSRQKREIGVQDGEDVVEDRFIRKKQ